MVVGLAAHEVFEEHCGVLGTASREYFTAESLGGLAVEDAVMLEPAEDISVEHLGPFVAVVAAGIAAAEDVAEASGCAAALHSRQQVGHGLRLDTFRLPLSTLHTHSVEGYVGEAEVELAQA